MGGPRTPQECLAVLRQTANALSGEMQEAAIVQALVGRVGDAYPTHRVLLQLLSPDGTTFLPAGSVRLEGETAQRESIPVSKAPGDDQLMAAEPVVIDHLDQVPSRPRSTPPSAGMAAAPLSVRGTTIGVLRLFGDPLESSELDLLHTLGELGAMALEKARLHQSLYRIASALNAAGQFESTLEKVLHATVTEMWLSAASVRLLDRDGKVLHLVAAYGLTQDYLSKGEIRVSSSPADQRALKGEVVIIGDIQKDEALQYPEHAAREGIRSMLVVPIRQHDRVRGVLRVYSKRPRVFDSVAQTFLASVADLVGLAMDNAELTAALQARYDRLKSDLEDWHRFLAIG